MRFAWLRKISANPASVQDSLANRILFAGYNLVWWTPILLAFTGVIDYRAGFIAFAAITLVRAGANLYRNNVLAPEQAERFPFRSP